MDTNNLSLIWKEEYNNEIGNLDEYKGNIEIPSSYNAEIKLPKVVKGNIYCTNNQNLTSLEGFPEIVKGKIEIYHTGLSSLKGSPDEVQGNFEITGSTNLKSLKYAPKKVTGIFGISMCSNLEDISDLPNNTTSVFAARCYSLTELNLEGKVIKEFFGLPFSGLTSLKGCPKTKHIDLTSCEKLETLEGIDTEIQEITLTGLGNKKEIDITPLLDFEEFPHIIIQELGDLGKKIIQLSKERKKFLEKFDKNTQKKLLKTKQIRRLSKMFVRVGV